MAKELGITVSRDKDFSEWYTQAILKSEMVDYSPISGCMVIRPYAYEIWERIMEFMDSELKKRGVKNAYFPLFITEDLLTKEKDHVEGFSPEVAWVTHGGSSKLKERIAVRPTSETIMYDSYSKWIRSHNDLPLKLNQWSNVVRWEFKHPTPFLRTREFLWQEGHSAFATKKEADEEVIDIINLYKQTYEELLAVPMLLGKKTDKEKFAGADYTMSVEGFLSNGKAIQGATSHGLGQNFAKSFDISFQTEDGGKDLVWQNSWGFSTRSIGIMVMAHGDDKGLVLPPKISPIQAVIVPIVFSGKPDKKITDASKKVVSELKKKGVRVHLDDRDNYKPGFKYNHWELKGVPLRIEIGPKDVEKNSVMLVRRIDGKKTSIKISELSKLPKLLEDIQNEMLKNAQKFLKNSIVEVKSMSELKKIIKSGKIALAQWCPSTELEEKIKDETDGAKTLNSSKKANGKCAFSGKNATEWIYFAKSY